MAKHTTPTPSFGNEKDLADYLLKHLGDNLREAVKATVSCMVKMEMQSVREELLASSGMALRFNGAYPRHLVSPFGKIENVPVPRFREQPPNGTALSSLGIFDNEAHRMHEIAANMHLLGISQRKVDELCRAVFGAKMPPKKTKEAFEELLEAEAFQVNSASLMDAPCAFLLLDGVWETVRSKTTGEARRRVTLVALGMDAKGEAKKLLGFHLAFEEDERSWVDFLESLGKRGFPLTSVQLVTADGAGGIAAALERLMPNVGFQSCLSHRYRNVLKKTSYKLKGEMGKDLRRLTASKDKEAFVAHATAMKKRWATAAPEAVKVLMHKLETSMAYLDLPQELWVKVRTSNALERAFREVRRRTNVNDDHFMHSESANRYHKGIFGRMNQKYFTPTTT
jgi:transposase-like protein